MSEVIVCNMFDQYENEIEIVEEEFFYYFMYVGGLYSEEEPRGVGECTSKYTAIDKVTGRKYACTKWDLRCPECGQKYLMIFNPNGDGSWNLSCNMNHEEVPIIGWN